MTENPLDQNWPEAEHPELDRMLASLGHLAPREGFADTVLARLEATSPATAPGKAHVPALRSRRVGWALLGGYSVASAFSAVFLVSWVGAHSLQIGTFLGDAGIAVAAFLQHFWFVTVARLPELVTSRAFLELLPGMIGLAVALWILTLVSAVGLYRIMNSYSIGRIPINARR